MGNFLGNLGAAFRGQQQYSDWQDQKEAAKLRIAEEKARLAEIEDMTSERSKQRARDPAVNQGYLDTLAEWKRRQDAGMGIAPPPSAPKPPPPADQVQPPAPGQASVPMMQPGQAPRMMGPPMDGGMPPPPPQGPPGPPQAQGMPPHGMQPPPPQQRPMAPPGPPMAPPQAPPIQPYKTVGGNAPPQQPPPGIPPPPQQNREPAPNSMTLADAADFIKSKGISDPTTSVQILDKLTPYLNNEAKQEAASLKMQLAHQEKANALLEKAREADERSQDTRLATQERAQARREAQEALNLYREAMVSLAGRREGRLETAATAGDGSNKLTPGGRAVQEELIRAGKPIPKGKRGEINYGALNDIAEHEEGGAGSGALTGGQAEYKANASTYAKVQQRSAGIELGVKKIEKDIKLLESTMAQGNAGFSTVLNQPLNYLRAKGSDPKLAAYALAAKNVAVEFERLRSGGMLSAAQLHAGAQEDAKNILNENMSVAETLEKLPIMLSEIQNGREAAQEVEKYYKDQLHVAKPPAATLPDSAKKMLKKNVHTKFQNGQTWMLDDSGNPVEVK